jgi:hypothetical protein
LAHSMMTRRAVSAALPALAAVGWALALAWAAGCSGGRSPSAPGGPDRISIAAISPAAGTTLAPGASVTFSATLDYVLSSSGAGSITLVVEDQDNRVLNPGNQVTTIVSQGAGSVKLTGQTTIPAAGVSLVRVFFPLVPSMAFSTQVVASAAYPVGAPRTSSAKAPSQGADTAYGSVGKIARWTSPAASR